MEDKLLITKATQKRLNLEAEADGDMPAPNPPLWYAVMETEAGIQHVESHHVWNHHAMVVDRPRPLENQIVWAECLVRLLNKHVGFDGSWLVEFTHYPDLGTCLSVDPDLNWRRIVLIWMDKDGDVQFSSEITDPFVHVISTQPEHWIEQMTEAYENWKDIMKKSFEKQKKAFTYNEAQGEVAPSSKG